MALSSSGTVQNTKIQGLFYKEVIDISATFNSKVSVGTSTSVAKSGYTPLAVAGWEVGSNLAMFLQRCELIGTTLYCTIRTTSNQAYTGNAGFNVTILYAKN